MATVYTKAIVYFNGNLLTEESTVTVKRESGQNDVETVAKGWAGVSPGAPKTKITVKNAVPSADFELDPGKFITNTQEAEISIFAAGRTLTAIGFVSDDNFTHGVGSAAELEFNFSTGPTAWV